MTDTPAAALARLSDALVRADQAMLRGDLDSMYAAQDETLDVLCLLAHRGQAIRAGTGLQPLRDEERTLSAVWQLLAALYKAGHGAFPFAGTLLGLERAGQLLPGDKGAGFGVWLEDFAPAVHTLQAMGLQRADNVPPLSNIATFNEPRTGLTLALRGMRREPQRSRVVGGAWLAGKPASHQRETPYPWFGLMARSSPAGWVWWPDDANLVLTAIYGQWVVRDDEWVSHVCSPAQQEFNLNWRCFAQKRLIECWLRGDAPRTRRLLDRTAARCGWDERLLRYRDALDATIAITPLPARAAPPSSSGTHSPPPRPS